MQTPTIDDRDGRFFSSSGLGLADAEFARKLEEAADRQLRHTISMVGVDVAKDDRWDLIVEKMRKHRVTMIHEFTENEDEHNGGWIIRKAGKVVARVSHPFIEKGRIKMHVKEFL